MMHDYTNIINEIIKVAKYIHEETKSEKPDSIEICDPIDKMIIDDLLKKIKEKEND